MTKIGRNDPCPCGSGKKYKKCCQEKSDKELSQYAIMVRLINEINRFVDKNHLPLLASAYPAYWGDIDIETDLNDIERTIAEGCFYEWVVFDFESFENRTFIDLFIDKNENLTAEELAVLAIMRRSAVGLYEVEEVFPGRGFILKDLLLGGLYEIGDVEMSNYMHKGNVLAARVIHLDEKYVIVGAGHPFQQEMKTELIEYVRDQYKDYCQEYPGSRMADFLKKAASVFNDFWCTQCVESDKRRLKEMSEILSKVSVAVYNVTDRQGVIQRMGAMEGVERVVVEERNNEVDDEAAPRWEWPGIIQDGENIMAIFDIHEGKFSLSCNHKGWFEKWKSKVDERLAGLVVFEQDALVSDAFDASDDKKELLKILETEVDSEDIAENKTGSDSGDKAADGIKSDFGNKAVDGIKSETGN
jgi:hypothetical protein